MTHVSLQKLDIYHYVLSQLFRGIALRLEGNKLSTSLLSRRTGRRYAIELRQVLICFRSRNHLAYRPVLV